MNLRAFVEKHRATFFFLVRYGISGATGGLIQTVGLYIWVSLFGFRATYLWGVVIAYCIAVVVSFVMQKYWTFRDYAGHMVPRQLFWYTTTSLGNLGLNALILHASKQVLEGLGFNFFHLWYLGVQVIAVFVVALSSFLSNRYITFRSVPL
ncbi:GtrA family protein [Candidatus Kaiserbacteria bacterium]|nr:GtrA family protein [Candidatus Kaiserbacteria bacterium]